MQHYSGFRFHSLIIVFICFIMIQIGCTHVEPNYVLIQAEDYAHCSKTVKRIDSCILIEAGNYIEFMVPIPVTGRYEIEINGASKDGQMWIEDYVRNSDDRTYNITGDISFNRSKTFQSVFKYGSPLAKGIHPIRVHAKQGAITLDWIKFTPIIEHDSTYDVIEQKMTGTKWKLVWADEFDGNGLPDSNKWSYNIGNWGWGNNELQYYTKANAANARIKDGNLIIQAHKNENDQTWTSARLTTHGKYAFKYGKIEFRAKVPNERGTWAAGWTLGSSYTDELSWPYCGEIDILECVGFEIDDSSKNGLNHSTCHTRAYYFKQGNQIGSDTTLNNMTDSFHTYSVEWHPDAIYGAVDGHRYYVYDKNKDSLEWPFYQPQDIILNLAIGGGWGGAKGFDSTMKSPKYIIDYVRVYDLD
ncbi:MAG: beta-glucanase (GH16 family) [Bacteroidia bacterium]|jgi:beta-glucanase (GH16 family)